MSWFSTQRRADLKTRGSQDDPLPSFLRHGDTPTHPPHEEDSDDYRTMRNPYASPVASKSSSHVSDIGSKDRDHQTYGRGYMISVSKNTLLGIIFAIMFSGILFFIGGFLTALVVFVTPPTTPPSLPTGPDSTIQHHDQPSTKPQDYAWPKSGAQSIAPKAATPAALAIHPKSKTMVRSDTQKTQGPGPKQKTAPQAASVKKP